jgi:hypothetical protein
MEKGQRRIVNNGSKGEEEQTQKEDKEGQTKLALTFAGAKDHARCQCLIDGKPVHIKHQCVAADCHCHITAILPGVSIKV